MSELTDEFSADGKGGWASPWRPAARVVHRSHEPSLPAPARSPDRRVYGVETPIKQLAQVRATDARLLTLTPFDKNSIGTIEKAIMESDLGLTPNNDGNVIGSRSLSSTRSAGRAGQGRARCRRGQRGRRAQYPPRCDARPAKLKEEGEVVGTTSAEEGRAAEAHDEATREISGLLKAKEEEILEVSEIPATPEARRHSEAHATSRSSPMATVLGGRARAAAIRAIGPAPTWSRSGSRRRRTGDPGGVTVFSFSTENLAPRGRR